jgi:hypothetical protein
MGSHILNCDDFVDYVWNSHVQDMPPQQVEDQSHRCSLRWCYRTMEELTSMSDVLYYKVLFIFRLFEQVPHLS